MNRVVAAPSPRRSGGSFTATATVVALAIVPVVVAVLFLAAHYEGGTLAFDLRGAYLPAAEAIVDGESPYPALHDPRFAAERAYVYPPLVAVVLTPATLLSVDALSVLAALASLALVLGILYLLGLRDWRCYGAAILWAPTLIGAQTASASLLVAFGVALAWIYRERPAPFAASLGLAIAVKLFVWPLVAWSLALGRVRAAVAATLAAAAAILLPWAVLGFEDLTRYPAILERLAEVVSEESYSVVAVAAAVGLPEIAGRAVAVLLGLVLLGVCAMHGRRGDDLRAFTAAIAAALAFTPVAWEHYLVLLLVPLALARPRFSPLWLLPIALWLAKGEDNGDPIQTVLPFLVAAILVGALLRRPEPSLRAATAAARP
jgi:alpha-1,2-mannosyltransferase